MVREDWAYLLLLALATSDYWKPFYIQLSPRPFGSDDLGAQRPDVEWGAAGVGGHPGSVASWRSVAEDAYGAVSQRWGGSCATRRSPRFSLRW
jgi:hypothetical protein